MTSLYDPIVLGDMRLSTRVLMAPLTRNRAPPNGVPGRWAATYYSQRASAGLIVSEATQISPMGKGYINTPGIHSDEQTAGWKRVVDAVHGSNGRIFLQLWHVGRISHTSLLPGNASPVAPSSDLPERLRRRGPLNAPDTKSFYGGDERGYIDYPEWANSGT